MRDMTKETPDMANFACEEFEERLVLYYYGDSLPDERHQVERHIAGCTRCHCFLDDLRHLLPQTFPMKELPARFWDDYFRETVGKLAAADARRTWWREFFHPVRAWVMPALATAGVAALALGLLFGKFGVVHKTSTPSRDKIPQEILADAGKLEFFNSLDLLESLSMLEKMEGLEPQS
jgi:hypothetical protein